MSPDQFPQLSLTTPQREALEEFGRRGSVSSFDPPAMSQLLILGLVNVRREERRLVLTERGRQVFELLTSAKLD